MDFIIVQRVVKNFVVIDEQPIIVFIIVQSLQGHVEQGEEKEDQNVEQQYLKNVKMFTNYVDTTSIDIKALGCFKQHPKFANLEGATKD